MKLYGSFLVRCWLIRDESEEHRAVIDVEHIQRGEHLRVSDFDAAYQWMMQRLMQALNSEPTTPEASADEKPSQEDHP